MMIKSKQLELTVTAKNYEEYNPQTFKGDDRFIECSAEYVLSHIEPVEFSFLPGRKFIVFDTETYWTGLPANKMPPSLVRRYIKSGSKDIPNDLPFCISLCDGKHSYIVYDDLKNRYAELRKLSDMLSDTSVEKIAHNTNYDCHMLANAGVQLRGRLHDTLYASKIARGNAFTHSLFDIAKEADGLYTWVDAEKTERKCYDPVLKFERMLNSYKAQYKITDYRQFPHELMTNYTGADTWNACVIFQYLYQLLQCVDGWEALYDKECAVGKIAYWAEREGIEIDPDYKDVLIPALTKEVQDAEEEIYKTAGRMFNINSGAQVASVLTDLGYGKHIKYNPPTEAMKAKGITKGNPCLDKFEMERLSNLGIPLVDLIQKFKASQKLLNTFAIKIYDMADSANRVHCNFNTIEAKTGRFSISSPSMQNMPRRKDARVRAAFTASPGWTLYDFDFKSQEAIVLAHYSRAAYLLEMINAGHDIHKATASIVYSVPIDEVTKEQRGDAKSVGFAVTYGAGAEKVANMTGKSVQEARSIIARYMKNIPEVDIFIKTANKVMKERGYVRTIDGRYIYAERGREYACVNYIIQGSSAGSTKARMVDIYKFLRANNYQSKIVLQIHDSLNGLIKDEEADELLPYWRWLQTERTLFRVPVSVDVAICKPTWRDKTDIDIPAVQPPQEMLDKMEAYDIWQEGIL